MSTLRHFLLYPVAAFAVALFATQGCSSTSRSKFNGGTAETATTSSSGEGGDCVFCSGGSGAGGDQAGVVFITPAVASLEVKDGVIPTQKYIATLNGADVSNNVTWVVEKPDVADVTTTGIVTPTGKVGGETKILALYGTAKGEALLTVKVNVVVNPANLSVTDQQLLDNAQANDASFKFSYPLNDAIVPLRVLAPEFMWQNQKTVQAYRIKLSSKSISYTEYFSSAGLSQNIKLLAQTQWENIQFSGLGPVSDPVKVELARLSGGTADATSPLSLRVAQGFVFGSVYYWQLPLGGSQGKVLRIKPSSDQTDEFFQSSACFGCHSVSRDGTKMMATFDLGGFNGFPQQLIDLTTTPAKLGTIQAGAGLTGVFSTFNNDGTKVAYSNNSSGSMSANSASVNIVDGVSGAQILPSALPAGCGEPSWSPDGTMLAGICGLSGGSWTFDSSEGNLTIAHLNAAQNQVLSLDVVVPKGNLPGRPAYPTFTPDSKYMAFGRPTQGSRSGGEGSLWLTDVQGKSPIELKMANGEGRSFNPIFAPKSAGGYTWIVYVSKRNYGNKIVNSNIQQLWMVAIDDPPTPGVDPSHPPFYLRGQVPNQLSENAYYAIDPCKKDGESCEHGIECCNKSCIYDDAQMKHVCKPSEGGDCTPTGSGPCKTDLDCCDFKDDVVCLNGFCELKPPI